MRRESSKLTIILLTLTLCFAGAAVAASGDVYVDASQISWDAAAGYRQTLSISGPGDLHLRQAFEPGEAPRFGAFSDSGELLADGVYNWELRAVPVKTAKRSDVSAALGAIKGFVRSGSFSLAGGAFLDPRVPEQAEKDIVHLDDVIVDGSLCVGFDCVNGESFGFDTLRLKENNVRIRFQDTSSTSSFPSNDWQITANDSSNGGAEKFSIDDIDGGRTPFTIEAGAPSHSLYVDDGGRIGFGTSTPVAELHVVDGDTPTLRLQQDGSSGFTAQTWDVAGNEAGFFVRDVTNGSTLPFRIMLTAPSESLVIDADGDIGSGTGTSADASLELRRTDGTGSILVDNTGSSGTSTLLKLTSDGRARVELENTGVGGSGSNWIWDINNAGKYSIIDGTDADVEFQIDHNGDVTVLGDVTANGVLLTSSRARKAAFAPADAGEILGKVSRLPISEWSFKSDEEGLRHVGPMAEDFYALFGLGGAETHISMTDASGVAFAAIQGLHGELESLRGENLELIRRLAALEAQLAVIAGQ